MVQLFDFVKLAFTADEEQWSELNDPDKSRNFFMMNRFLSIKYPVQVAVLSHMKIDAPSTMDYWHTTLRKLYKSVPSWIYAKTKKKSTEDKKKNMPSDQMVAWYCQHEEISTKEYMTSVKMFGEPFLSEIRELEKTLKSQGLLKSAD
jgi:hypothetical protein